MDLLCLGLDLLIGPDDNRRKRKINAFSLIVLSLVTFFPLKELLTDHKISSGYKRNMAA